MAKNDMHDGQNRQKKEKNCKHGRFIYDYFETFKHI